MKLISIKRKHYFPKNTWNHEGQGLRQP